jgi:raffinose/stachyose/melibiose transport system substrate-binding protein
MAAGNVPQIFDLFGGTKDAQKYAQAGKLLDLTPIIEELGIKDQFMDLSAFSVDGKVYGLPIGSSAEGMYYNTEIFTKYNLTAPKTWDEFENILATLKSNGVTPLAGFAKDGWAAAMLPNSLWARFAGPEFIAGLKDNTSDWTSPEITAAMTKLDEWNKKEYFVKGQLGIDYAGRIGQISTGKAALMFDGSWSSSSFADPKQAGDVVGKIGFFFLPPAPGGKGDQTAVNGNSSANGYGFRADLNENELKAAKAFIKNMYTLDNQEKGLLTDNTLPSMKLPKESTDKVTDQIVRQVTEGMSAAGALFPVFDAYVTSEVNTAIEQNVQKLFSGKITPAEFGQNVAKAAGK